MQLKISMRVAIEAARLGLAVCRASGMSCKMPSPVKLLVLLKQQAER